MGDEDDEYSIGKMDQQDLNAFMKLIDMKMIIDGDSSGYYQPDVPPTLEESLRKEVPALKDAWDQYQVILRFAKSEHYNKELNDE